MIRRNKLTTTKKQYVIYWIVVAVMMSYVVTLIYPYVWTLIMAFSDVPYLDNMGKLLPDIGNFTLDGIKAYFNYKTKVVTPEGTIVAYGLIDLIGNTLFISITRTFLGMIFSIATAYCYTFYKFRGRNFLFFYGVIVQSIPLFGGMGWMYKILYQLNLYDTYFSVFFRSIGTFNNFLFYFAFFKGVGWDYAEAAFIDGAGHFTIFVKIMLPQILPIVVVFIVNGFIGAWNDWMTCYLWLPSKPMIAYSVYLSQEYAKRVGNYQLYYSAIIFSMVVPMCLYGLFSKRILSTVYTGGLKG